jgi:UDP-N-acetylmuramate dehydrogenase
MNAGTNEGEIRDIIVETEAVTEKGEILILSPADMKMGYRSSVFQEKEWLVLSAVFNLIETNGKEALKNIDAVWKERAGLYPMQMPNAGSVFRNPEGSHAGYLIEQAGLKGTKVGGARVSEKHGNFIVNAGDATSADIIALIDLVRKRIEDETGITLVLEQKILPVRP